MFKNVFVVGVGTVVPAVPRPRGGISFVQLQGDFQTQNPAYSEGDGGFEVKLSREAQQGQNQFKENMLSRV